MGIMAAGTVGVTAVVTAVATVVAEVSHAYFRAVEP
jgi:hypothetical protein